MKMAWRVALFAAIVFMSGVLASKEEMVNGGASCTNNTDCGEGFCVKSKCMCPLKFTGSTCEYGRKSLKSTFLFSLFLGMFGAARFYLGLTASAAVQLVLGILVTLCNLTGKLILPLIFSRSSSDELKSKRIIEIVILVSSICSLGVGL